MGDAAITDLLTTEDLTEEAYYLPDEAHKACLMAKVVAIIDLAFAAGFAYAFYIVVTLCRCLVACICITAGAGIGCVAALFAGCFCYN